MFTEPMVYTLSWQGVRQVTTESGQYRVEITWSCATKRYQIRVWRRVQEPERLIEVRYAWHARTAVKTANRLLRKYSEDV